MRTSIAALALIVALAIPAAAQHAVITLSPQDVEALSRQAERLVEQARERFDRADGANGLALLQQAAELESGAQSLQFELARLAENQMERSLDEEEVESLAATARAAYGRVLEVADISSITKMRADRGLARLAQLQTNRLEDLERREETADDYLVMATSNLPTRPGERSSGSVARTSSGGYRNITSASQFHNLVQRSGLPVLVEIGASWCPPCRAMEPHIRSLAAERSSSLLVLAVDGDDVPTVAQRFGVQAYPTLIMMRGGREVGRIVGGMDKQNLALFVDRY